ncbi:hypothetical protein GC174_09305 [bacterium]|nr:hypothetical protein [bacterium]
MAGASVLDAKINLDRRISMKASAKLVASLAAASLAFSLQVAPVSAQFNWAQVPAMIDVPGRISSTEAQILEEQAAGRLSAEKAAELKKTLDDIKALDIQYRVDGKLSIVERMKLMLELDNLGKTIQVSLTERKAAITDVTGRQTEVAKKISDALVSGRLTSQEAADFNTKLAAVKSQENSFRADGSLSTTETLQLSLALDQLDSAIESSLRTRVIADPGVDAKQVEIGKRIDSLLSGGKITSTQAATLKQELSRIATREQAFKTSGGELTAEETLTLALELERLNAQVDRYDPVQVSTQVKGIDTRQLEVKNIIAEGQRTGKLSVAQAGEFAHEYDRIEALEAMYRVDGGLSDSEILTLVRDLDNLQKNVEDSISKASATALSLQDRRDLLRKKITDAKTTGLLKPETVGDELLAELARIESKETFYKLDGSLNDTETLIIAGDIDKLNDKFEATKQKLPSVSDRKTALEAKLNGALASGRLESKAADDIRNEIARIGFLESTFKGNDGNIDQNETVALNREYDGVERKLTALLPALPDIDKIQQDINKKIEEGAAKGKISSAKAMELKGEYERIARIEDAFRKTDSALVEWEVLALNKDLEKLGGQVDSLVDSEKSSNAGHASEVAIDTSQVAPDTRGHWAEKYIAILQQRGTIGGFPDGSFKPNNGITRAQFAAIAMKALGLPEAGRPAKFGDLSSKHWAYKAVSAVSEAGLVGGYPDGSFRPEDKITRAQAFVILSKALNKTDDDVKVLDRYKDGNKVAAWAIPSVAKAANAGILVNYPDAYQIRPGDEATRAEVAALTYQTMSNLGKDLPRLTIGLEATTKGTN